MITLRATARLTAAPGLALSLSACSSTSDTATESSAPASPTSSATSSAASPTSSATSSVGAASEAFCTSSAALKTELGDLRTLVTGGGVTAEELQAQRAELATAGDQTRTDAQALDTAVRAEVLAAQEAFQTAIFAIPADATGVPEAAAYVAAAAAFGTALDGIDDQVGCA